jgi:transcriptional regulator with XRE-family HTH domain
MSAENWIELLRSECQRAGQSQAVVAKKIGYSKTVVSQVLNGKYPGDLDKVEMAVRGAYENFEVVCPELGGVRGDVCAKHQRNAPHWSGANIERRRMYIACRKCPRYLKGESA